MRSKLFVLLGALVLALGIAACGSSKKKTTSTSSSTASTTQSTPTTTTGPKGGKGAAAAARGRAYRVRLAGKAEIPAGPANAGGTAVVSLRPKTSQICWRYTALHGFTPASVTASHIHRGARGVEGPIVLPLFAGTLRHNGCVATTAALIQAIERNPHAYYVNIHTKQHPGGVVRAQL